MKFKKLSFCQILVAIFSVLAFSACTENEPVDIGNDIPNQTVTLAHSEGDMIRIPATIGNKSGDLGLAKSPDRGRFQIDLKFVFPVTDRQREVFEVAIEKWQRVIIKDVPSITAVGGDIPSAFLGFPPVALEGETIDDILIEVALVPFDGPGGILGAAAPRFVRDVDNLTVTGFMLFDTADLDFLDFLGLFDEVIVHEMGHVLGIGTLWDDNRELITGTLEEPYFSGKTANVHWRAEGGTDFLPIENTGGPGTRFSHWRESVLVNELMTGFLNLGENPLSRITAGSLRDLGYGVGIVGDRYELTKGAPGVDPEALEAAGEGLFIANRENLYGPIGIIETK